MEFTPAVSVSLWSPLTASTTCRLRQTHEQRNFNPTAPNPVWTGDITYIATDEGWLYLAAVLDLHSRQVVGFSMQSHMRANIVIDALRMAWFRRKPSKDSGLIFHSDRGSQYCSDAYQAELAGFL